MPGWVSDLAASMASMPTGSFTIAPGGPFSLAEAATFGFGQRAGGGWDGVMRLAFCLDGYADQVGWRSGRTRRARGTRRVPCAAWKPLRTWAVVLIRSAGPRLLGEAGTAPAGAPARVR